MSTLTKQQIVSLPIRGNAHDDMHIFHHVHAFTIDTTNSYKDRADVQEWMETQVMGCDSSRTDDKLYVESYLADM